MEAYAGQNPVVAIVTALEYKYMTKCNMGHEGLFAINILAHCFICELMSNNCVTYLDCSVKFVVLELQYTTAGTAARAWFPLQLNIGYLLSGKNKINVGRSMVRANVYKDVVIGIYCNLQNDSRNALRVATMLTFIGIIDNNSCFIKLIV